MGSRKVGFVTIGQSPRTDILEDLEPLLDALKIIERGALDGFSPNDLEAVAPLPGETPYVSRLYDGSQVLLSPEKTLSLLQKALDSVVGSGAEMVVVLCTGSFPTLQCPVPLLFPDRLLRGFVKGVLLSESTLGVVVPLSEQVATARESWSSMIPHVHTASLSPYLDFAAGVEECQTLEGCDLIVMDCLGYTIRHKEMLKRLLNIPVVLARTVVARAVQELIDY
jgi:protein AroM